MGATISFPMSTIGMAPSPILANTIRAIAEDLSKEPLKPKDLSGVLNASNAMYGANKITTNNNAALSMAHQFMDSIKAKAQLMLGLDMIHHINYALVGRPGVGKSSLVNALRLVDDDESNDAAPVGEVETTKIIQKYKHPNFPHIMLWDLPGAGTLSQPGATYYEDNMLYAFDCVLILSSDRFDAFDYEIAYKAMIYKTECAFVRTKADISIAAIAQRENVSMIRASTKFKEIVHRSFLAGLKASPYISSFPSNHIFHLFILSAWAFDPEKHPYYYYDHNRPVPYYWRDNYWGHESKLDRSLEKMDEEEFLHYITQAISSRVKLSP